MALVGTVKAIITADVIGLKKGLTEANSSDCNFPSRTAAVRMSVAWTADRFSAP